MCADCEPIPDEVGLRQEFLVHALNIRAPPNTAEPHQASAVCRRMYSLSIKNDPYESGRGALGEHIRVGVTGVLFLMAA